MSCKACQLDRARCCRLRVPVSIGDVERLGHIVEALWPHTDLPGDYVAELPRRMDGRCLFLDADESCAIYHVRPQACRDQQASVCRGLS